MPNPSFSGWFCHHGIIDHLAPPKQIAPFHGSHQRSQIENSMTGPPKFLKMNPTLFFSASFGTGNCPSHPFSEVWHFWVNDFPSYSYIICIPPNKTNMTMENPLFEDVFPVENGEFPMSCLFSGVYTLSPRSTRIMTQSVSLPTPPWAFRRVCQPFPRHVVWVEPQNSVIGSGLPLSSRDLYDLDLQQVILYGFGSRGCKSPSNHGRLFWEPSLCKSKRKVYQRVVSLFLFLTGPPLSTSRMFLFRHRMRQWDCWFWRCWLVLKVKSEN